MMQLSYDLHLHSCLSPCGDADMTPGNIAGMAFIKGLEVIALTDHNSCKNCPAMATVCENYGLLFIPGMELTTEEEVHVVCLFPTLADAMDFDKEVYSRILPIKNSPEVFGYQQIVDSEDNIIAEEPLLLINATSISFDEVFPLAERFHGVAFPAHIDKNANSLLSNLGFIPPDSKFKTAELKDSKKIEQLASVHSYLNKCNIITNSDAHYLADISEPGNKLKVKEKSALAVLEAIKNTIIIPEG